MFFVCPKCKGKLIIKDTGAAVCGAGHSYDKSRFGYYNLLLGGSGGDHGDNREMVKARREFLGSGFYEPLASSIAELAAKLRHTLQSWLVGGCSVCLKGRQRVEQIIYCLLIVHSTI